MSWKCIFCDKGATASFRGKSICDDCFKEIFDWSKHRELLEKINGITKVIEDYIKRDVK